MTSELKNFTCFYCDGFDGLGWRGTRVVSVTATNRDEAKTLAEAKCGREVIRIHADRG